jgi:hypothetical protein
VPSHFHASSAWIATAPAGSNAPPSDPALLALARGSRFPGLFNFSGRDFAAAAGTLRPWDCVWLAPETGQPLT